MGGEVGPLTVGKLSTVVGVPVATLGDGALVLFVFEGGEVGPLTVGKLSTVVGVPVATPDGDTVPRILGDSVLSLGESVGLLFVGRLSTVVGVPVFTLDGEFVATGDLVLFFMVGGDVADGNCGLLGAAVVTGVDGECAGATVGVPGTKAGAGVTMAGIEVGSTCVGVGST